MAKTLSVVLGVVFLAVGALGFFQDPILGLFDVDLEHNIVHLVTGAVLLAVPGAAALRVLGVVYLVVTVLGFVMGPGELLGLVSVNGHDNWLHLALTVVLLAASMAKGSAAQSVAPSAPAPMV